MCLIMAPLPQIHHFLSETHRISDRKMCLYGSKIEMPRDKVREIVIFCQEKPWKVCEFNYPQVLWTVLLFHAYNTVLSFDNHMYVDGNVWCTSMRKWSDKFRYRTTFPTSKEVWEILHQLLCEQLVILWQDARIVCGRHKKISDISSVVVTSSKFVVRKQNTIFIPIWKYFLRNPR